MLFRLDDLDQGRSRTLLTSPKRVTYTITSVQSDRRLSICCCVSVFSFLLLTLSIGF